MRSIWLITVLAAPLIEGGVAVNRAAELDVEPKDFWTLALSTELDDVADGKLTAHTVITQPQGYRQEVTAPVTVNSGRARWELVYPLIDEGRFDPQPGTWDGFWEMGNYEFSSKLMDQQKAICSATARLDPMTLCPSDPNGPLIASYPWQFVQCAPERPAYIDTDFMSFTIRVLPGRVKQCDAVIDVVQPRGDKPLAGPWRMKLTGKVSRKRFDTTGWPRGEYWIRIRVTRDAQPVGPYVVRKVWKEILPPEQLPKEPQALGDRPPLLASAADFEEVQDVRFVSDPLEKQPHAPLVTMTEPWESELMFFRSLRYDEKHRQYRLEYTVGMGEKSRAEEFARLPATTALATSHDGLKWAKPEVGLVEYRGSTQNNLIPDDQVWASRITQSAQPTLSHDLEKATFRFYDAQRDGPVDMNNFFVAAVKRSFITRCENPPKFYQGGSYPLEKRGDLYLVLTPEPILYLGVGMDLYHTTESIRLHLEDKSTGTYYYFFRPGAPCYPPHHAVYDNMHMTRRCLGVMWTRDGIQWNRRLTLVPDEFDVQGTELYALSLFTGADEAVSGRPALALEQHKYNVAIEGNRTYLSGIYIYDSQDNRQWPEALWVRDPLHWHRFDPRRKMIANGPPGSYDFGMVKIRSWYYEFGDQWWFPYIAINGRKQNYPGLHRCDTVAELRELYPQYRERPDFTTWEEFWKKCKAMRYYPALARCPKGRVCHAEPVAEEGVLTTKPLTLQGDTLLLNAATEKQGTVSVEVLDAGGQPLAGFGRTQCHGFQGDSLHAAVSWKDADLIQLKGKTVRLRFILRGARLYSFHSE